MNIERLKTCLEVQTTTYQTEKMQKYILKFIREHKIGCTIVKDKGNIYITKGESDIYPCIIAHTDTVHDMYSDFKLFEMHGELFAMTSETGSIEQVGTGGDDKVGVFIALEMLLSKDNIKVAFFEDEEVGCDGSYRANMRFFGDVGFILQCDRQGNTDFVSSIMGQSLYSDDFADTIAPILKAYDRKECAGGLTDVYALKSQFVGVCVANMSCGYWEPHSDTETVNIKDVRNTLNMVIDLFATLEGAKWEHEHAIWKKTELTKSCPHCASFDLQFDAFTETHFCMDCQDYVTLQDTITQSNEYYPAKYFDHIWGI